MPSVTLKPVRDQVVVIVGASSGIGLATARMAAEQGAKVVIAARNEEALKEIAEDIERRGGQALPVAVEAASGEDLERLARLAIERFGRIDTWINNAAVAVYGTLEQIPLADHRRIFEVNYFGVVQGSMIAVRHLREHGGALINTGSVLSERAMILQTPYSATKHAVKAFTDGLRMELEQQGVPISVTLIKPSGIDTPYPEHARNYLDAKGLTIPPPAYDPHVVAKAMLFAAENPKRELTVGFGGWAIAALGTVAPRLTDLAMEATGYGSQTTDQGNPPERRDNLYEHREDGAEYSTIPGPSRKTSFFLEAQMHPLATAAILGAVGFAAAALLGGSGAGRRYRAGDEEARGRHLEDLARRTANGQGRPGRDGRVAEGYRPAHGG